jgi:GMP synthase-like glutamine amidotransferase
VRALVIQHDHLSPTGPVGRRLTHHGFDIDEFLVVPESHFEEPNHAVDFPDTDPYDLVVPLGAPWGAWEDEKIGDWLLPELELIRSLVEADKPVLGICFGGQLLARALGGSVGPSRRAEIGWTSIWSDRPELVSNGPWFQFHYDSWTVPPLATEIARTPSASQAFTIRKALAVQFHPELESSGLTGWLEWGGARQVLENGQDPDVMAAQTIAEDATAEIRTNHLVDAYLRDVAKLIP